MGKGVRVQGPESPMRKAGGENQCAQCPEEWGLPLGRAAWGGWWREIGREHRGQMQTALLEKPAENEVFCF